METMMTTKASPNNSTTQRRRLVSSAIVKVAVLFLLLFVSIRHTQRQVATFNPLTRFGDNYAPSLLSSPPSQSSQSSPSLQSSPQSHGIVATATAAAPKAKNARFAYIFLLAGINPDNRAYKGYLLNIWMCAHILKVHNTQADMILVIQFSNKATRKELPAEDIRITDEVGLKLRVLDTLPTEFGGDSFIQVIFEKLRIFQFTQYERVMYLDADVLAHCSLDYLFEESVKDPSERLVMDNFFGAGSGSPLNAGLVMVKPEVGDWERIQEIISERDRLNGTAFDHTYGWGYPIVKPEDHWSSQSRAFQKGWGFHGGQGDQGLLFHYLRYEKHSVTQLHQHLESWEEIDVNVTLPNGTIAWTKGKSQSKNYNKTNPLNQFGCHEKVGYKHVWHPNAPRAPGSDIEHFLGEWKPWMLRPRYVYKIQIACDGLVNLTSRYDVENQYSLWCHTFKDVIDTYGVTGLDLTDWAKTQSTALAKSSIGFALKDNSHYERLINARLNQTANATGAN